MKLQSDTKDIQDLLAGYCKTGKEVPIPGIAKGRIHHYRRLVFNVIKNTMDQAYPIASSSMEAKIWDSLVDEFFSTHSAASTQIWKLPFEFYEYHKLADTAGRLNMPYLNDLLYFEWAEIEIHTMPDVPYPSFLESGNILNDSLVLNPEHEILQLEYPVHKHALKEIENKKGLYHVLLFREPETGNVRFMELSVLHAFILMKISETGLPLQEFKGEIASISGVESEKFLDDFLISFIQDLMKSRMVLGYSNQ
ncbi:DUF2063 domain-containing protein [Bacteroidota bacterium]